jgi:hypothetical protein
MGIKLHGLFDPSLGNEHGKYQANIKNLSRGRREWFKIYKP